MTTPPIISHVYNSDSEMATTRELSVQFSIEAMVRGYHAYQSVWEVVVREELALGSCTLCFTTILLCYSFILDNFTSKVTAPQDAHKQ